MAESVYLPQAFDPDAPLFTVTVAARLADMHPQTLRGYDRLGLVVPSRSSGRGRRYTLRDVGRLRRVQQLSGDGINLEGIRRILELESHVEELQGQVARLLELLRAPAEQPSARTFTAGTGGLVQMGRVSRTIRQTRALTAGD